MHFSLINSKHIVLILGISILFSLLFFGYFRLWIRKLVRKKHSKSYMKKRIR